MLPLLSTESAINFAETRDKFLKEIDNERISNPNDKSWLVSSDKKACFSYPQIHLIWWVLLVSSFP